MIVEDKIWICRPYMCLLERLHYKASRLFGYSLIMCEYMKGKLKLQLKAFQLLFNYML